MINELASEIDSWLVDYNLYTNVDTTNDTIYIRPINHEHRYKFLYFFIARLEFINVTKVVIYEYPPNNMSVRIYRINNANITCVLDNANIDAHKKLDKLEVDMADPKSFDILKSFVYLEL